AMNAPRVEPSTATQVLRGMRSRRLAKSGSAAEGSSVVTVIGQLFAFSKVRKKTVRLPSKPEKSPGFAKRCRMADKGIDACRASAGERAFGCDRRLGVDCRDDRHARAQHP